MSVKEFWSWVIIGIGVLVILALGVFQPAHSHERWASGEEIPSWVRQACCSKSHAHHITDESLVHEMQDGIHIDGYKFIIPYTQVLPSPDGSTWIFYPTFPDGTQGQPYCFFRGIKGV